MPKNLLQIIQTAQAELGLPQTTTVIGNTDVTTAQMLAFANAVLDDLRAVNSKGWTAQQFEYNLVVNAPTITTGDTTNNSSIITNIPSTAGILANFFTVNGADIPAAARVVSVDSAAQVTMSMRATATAVGIPLTFSQDTYAIPSDFSHYQNNTWWDRTNFWELLGPDSPQLDQWHRSGIFTTGPRRHFRQIGPYANTFRLWPQPTEITNPLQIVFEYISLNAVKNLAGTAFTRYFALDTDIPLLDDRAVTMGIKFKFWQQKGFNWAGLRSDYDTWVDQLIARDGGAEKLNLVRQPNNFTLLSPSNVQDGNFPS